MKLLEKLLAIQIELKAPKSQYNSFGKYKFRNCEDILEAVKPLCLKNKAVLTVSDEVENIHERYYIKATATLHDTESEEKISVTARAREEEDKKGMDGSQVTGASSSYARKYALDGLFAIDDTKDSDTTNTGDKGEGKPKIVQKANKQVLSEVEKQLKELAEEHGYELEDIRISCQEYFKKSINELTDEELAKIIKAYSK